MINKTARLLRNVYNGCIHDKGFDEIRAVENNCQATKLYCVICGKHILTHYSWDDEFDSHEETNYHDPLWKFLHTKEGHEEILRSVLTELHFPVPNIL